MIEKMLDGCRVLVVEDEILVLIMTEGMLRELGCRAVMAAGTVDAALALIATQSFDAAMLDLNLKGDKSFPIADALAARNIPFAFVTGYGPEGLNESYRHSLILRKPYMINDLATIFEIMSVGNKTPHNAPGFS